VELIEILLERATTSKFSFDEVASTQDLPGKQRKISQHIDYIWIY